jgi:Trk K+ transport system NAD-binding subunit
LFAILLTQRGINGGDSIKALVFFTIIMTVFCQGLTAGWLVKWLRITSQDATGAVIVGCNPLGLLIARFFQERGESVVMIDTDPECLAQAEAQNLRVIASSALDGEILEEAGIGSMGTFLAITSNGEVNFVLAQRAAEEFNPPRVLAIFPRHPQGSPSENSKVNQAFVSDLPIKIWNEYLSSGQVKLGTTTLNDTEFDSQKQHIQEKIQDGILVPLLLDREEHLLVMSATEEWEIGDRIIYLLYDARPNLLKLLSGASQSTPLTVETLAEVEEVRVKDIN